MNFALLVCYIGYRLTPAVPPRQAAPPHPALRVRPARPMCRGAARVLGGGHWALGESSLDSNDETRFLVSFWKTGCEADPVCPDRDTDALGHCAPRGSRRGLFPQGRGQQGRGRGRSPGPRPGQRRVCLCQGGSSREAGWPPLPAGRGPGPRRLPHAHADSPATRSRKLTAWSRGGAALSRGQALAVALTRRPLGPGTIPSFRPRSLIAEGGARCLRPLRTALEGRPRPLVGPGSRRVPRVLT